MHYLRLLFDFNLDGFKDGAKIKIWGRTLKWVSLEGHPLKKQYNFYLLLKSIRRRRQTLEWVSLEGRPLKGLPLMPNGLLPMT